MSLATSGTDLLQPLGWPQMLLRLGLAVLVGAIVGWEREFENKPAGLRTHMLVSLGAALFVMTAVQTGILADNPDGLSRIIQGIVTGIGFLGAGEIINISQATANQTSSERVRVRGLTSAAAIWVAAALGTAMGSGLWAMGLAGAIATFLILWGVKKFERGRRSD